MVTYSLIVECFNPFKFSENAPVVATAKNGKHYRFFEINGRYFAVLKTYGSALLHVAEKEKVELGADFLVKTESEKYFPGHAEIIDKFANEVQI